MLRFENTKVYGLEKAIISSGYSFRSASKLDPSRDITDKDWKRGKMLGNASSGLGHDGYLKGIVVQADVTYPQYWTKQAQRYHYFEIVMSTSCMHMLCKNALLPFEEFKKQFNEYVDEDIIRKVQNYAKQYNECPDEDKEKKYELFMKMESNNPLGYELTMAITTNYLQLKTMYLQRKTHRLKEDWGTFCEWCESLPHFKELTGCGLKENDLG